MTKLRVRNELAQAGQYLGLLSSNLLAQNKDCKPGLRPLRQDQPKVPSLVKCLSLKARYLEVEIRWILKMI
jgi:hypothetical protein